MNKEINGYKLIDCDDDAIYVAKSKQDVLNYWIENYGTPLDLIGLSDEEFLEDLVVMELNSERVTLEREFLMDEDTGDKKKSTYWDFYKEAAEGCGVECEPILWYNI